MATNKEWALKMIPVLIRWAQATWDKPHYYSDLSAAVGHKTNQIGNVLGIIQTIIKDLGEKNGKRIPTLNSLVQNKEKGLPSNGFDIVKGDYSKWPLETKFFEVQRLNYEAHIYDWSWVLKELGLKPARLTTPEKFEIIKKDMSGAGGEGKEHKAIKDFIASHPESIGIRGVKLAKTEEELLSGDRLDVYFECRNKIHYAIEVKPKTSPEKDVLRGIYQCVKYKAVMDAMRVFDNDNYENNTLLVIAGKMSDLCRHVAIDLNVKYIENFGSK